MANHQGPRVVAPPPKDLKVDRRGPLGVARATLRAIGGGQDHPLMGIRGGLATSILTDEVL